MHSPSLVDFTLTFSWMPPYIRISCPSLSNRISFQPVPYAAVAMAENAASRARYQHRQLQNTDSIRVLHLLPGAFDDDINVELAEVTLSRSPPYEALSYVWGSPTPTDPISCHGEDILVTANCISAMRHLRHKKKPRTLWIDAICIDQSLMDERNHQVGLMGDIYSKAKRVVIWLGEETVESDYLMSFLKTYYRIQKYLPSLCRFLLSKQLKKAHSKYSSNGLLQPLRPLQSLSIILRSNSILATSLTQFLDDRGFRGNGQYRSMY